MNPALEKIKKLLRLSRDKSATPSEAATALAMAMKLAQESGIDLDKVSTEDNASTITHKTTPAPFGQAERSASSLIRKHFNVEALFAKCNKKPVVHFYGYPESCDLAIYVFVYLVRCSKDAWKKRTNRRLKNRNAFICGFFLAIDEMMPPKFHRPGVIPAFTAYRDAVLLAGAKLISRSIIPKKTPTRALTAGFIAGKKNGINNAIRGTNTPLLS